MANRSVPKPTKVKQGEPVQKVIIHPSIMSGWVKASNGIPFFRMMAPARVEVSKVLVFVEGKVDGLELTAKIEPLDGPTRTVDGVGLQSGKYDLPNAELSLVEGDRISVILNQDTPVWYAFVYRTY